MDSYFIPIVLISLISFILLRRGEKSKLSEPPLVPYKYPIIGHTFDYYKDTKNFIEKCQAEYGEVFSLYVFGRVITFIGKELTPEIFKNHKEFSFNEASDEFFPLAGFMNRRMDLLEKVIKVVQVNLTGGLKSYTDRIQKQLIKSIDGIIGDGKVLKPPLKFIQLIIAKPIAATFVGDELSDDDELVNSFAYITRDISKFLSVPPVLNFIHPSLHKKLMIILFKLSDNPFKVHREIIKKKVVPEIEKRLSEMKKSGNAYVSPTDLLQRFIELDDPVDYEAVIDYMIVTIFASVHTTSTNLLLSMQELVDHPQYYEELLEEQVQLYESNENCYYSTEQIAKLEKLDSFIKETLRVSTSTVGLSHKTMSLDFTFSNGYQIPKGRLINIRMGEIHFDEEFQGQNPNEFNGFRYLKKNSPATRAERGYLTFGLGKHACPGRFFAINEIKVALHYLLLKYNIRKDNDEKISPTPNGLFRHLSDEGLVFEKRSVN